MATPRRTASSRASSPSTPTPAAPAAAAAAPAPLPEAGEVRYTWSELDAAVGAATARDTAAFDVTVPVASLTAEGSLIASDRILTDARRIIGQLVDYERRVGSGTFIRGYAPGLLRVFVKRVQTLRRINDNLGDAKTRKKLRAAAVTAEHKALQEAGLEQHYEVHQAIAGAVANDKAARAEVEKIYPRPGVARLADSLRDLSKLLKKTLGETAFRERAEARGLSDSVVTELTNLAKRVEDAHEASYGSMSTGAFTASDRDAADGACLLLMGELFGLFPKGMRREGVPVLVPIATRRYFDTNAGRKVPTPEAPKPEAPKPVTG